MSIKIDRDLYKRLLSPAGSGRNIDFLEMPCYELPSVPLSLATSDNNLLLTEKCALANILAEGHFLK